MIEDAESFTTDEGAKNAIIEHACEEFRELGCSNLKPFVPFLIMKGRPMSFKYHFPMLPFFKYRRPRRTVFMCGRQEGKSASLSASAILRSRLIGHYDVLGIQPRYEQIKRFSTLYVGPMLNDSPFKDWLVDSSRESSIMARAIGGGGTLHYAYAFLTPDATRGFAVQELNLDESLIADTEINVYGKGSVKISDIKAGDTVVSFTDDGYTILSTAIGDASYHGKRGCYKITTESGRTVEGTIDHPLITDKGPMRIGEMVKYVYGKSEKNDGNFLGGSNSDDSGDLIGGCSLNSSEMEEDSLLQSKTRRSATQLQSSKIHDIVRVRYSKTCSEEEREVQSLLLGNSQTRRLFLSIQCSIQRQDGEQSSEEDCDTGVAGFDRQSRTSLVDTRRRLSSGWESNEHMHTGFFESGKQAPDSVAGSEMGHKSQDEERREERETVSEIRPGEYGYACGSDSGPCSREYDVQDSEKEKYMPCVPERIVQGEKARGVFKNKTEYSERSLDEGAQRGAETIQEELEAGEQRACEQKRKETVQKESGKSKRSAKKIQRTLSGSGERDAEKIPPDGDGETEKPGKFFETVLQEKGIYAAGEGRSDLDRIVKIEYTGEKDVYDIEVVGTHNYVLANGCKSLNCQDIQNSFIPIIEEVLSAQTEHGLRVYAGTPKAVENTLNAQFMKSSMGYVHITCERCNKENIANKENHIYKMIGKKTCICAFCGRPLNLLKMRFVHHHPERRNKYEGYHISQVTHPLHAWFPEKWSELVDKLDDPDYSEVTFENEILGVASDHNDTPLTEAELREACDPEMPNDLNNAINMCKKANTKVVGVDWSGFGAGQKSTTVVVVACVMPGEDAIRIVYAERLSMGADAEAEAVRIRTIFNSTGCPYLAHDFSGAGTIREALVSQMGVDKKKFIPYDLVHAPVRKKIISFYKPSDGGRSCYNIDKTRSLMVLYQMVKKKKVIFPNFEQSKSVIKDFLNIMQETRPNPRGSDFILMDKIPETTDDCVHAANFACSTIWHMAGKYPEIAPQVTDGSEEASDLIGDAEERERVRRRIKGINLRRT